MWIFISCDSRQGGKMPLMCVCYQRPQSVWISELVNYFLFFFRLNLHWTAFHFKRGAKFGRQQSFSVDKVTHWLKQNSRGEAAKMTNHLACLTKHSQSPSAPFDLCPFHSPACFFPAGPQSSQSHQSLSSLRLIPAAIQPPSIPYPPLCFANRLGTSQRSC